MMYEDLIKRLRNVSVDLGQIDHVSVLLLEAADAIEAQDRHILTLQHEMMGEAESHIAEANRLNKQIEELQADMKPVVRGQWFEKEGVLHPLETDGICTVCGYVTGFYNFFNFCPKCGADMQEPPKEDAE